MKLQSPKGNYTNQYQIAQWKLDTPFENWLGKLADKSEFWKRIYVLYYDIFDHEYYKNGFKFIDSAIENSAIYRSTGRLPLPERMLKRDMIYSLHRYGATYIEYFRYEYYRKNSFGKNEYITDKLRFKLYEQINNEVENSSFKSKAEAYKLFENYLKRDVQKITCQEDRSSFLNFIKNHSSFIMKPIAGFCGRGIEIKRMIDEKEAITIFDDIVSSGSHYVVEELIEQSEQMSCFHPSSVNTLRIPTMIRNGEYRIICPFLRCGQGGKSVDNVSSGGICAAVDPESGIVTSKGYTKSGDCLMKHPDTEITFLGYQIPEWENLKLLVRELIKVVNSCDVGPNRFYGWDLAHTNGGWVLVECNEAAQIESMQSTTGKGIKQEFLEYLGIDE